jgi:glycosyltransferase involved in cell wall biosynthesis
VIAGDGTQRANVERAAAESGLNGRVDFLGTVDDDRLVALYRDALAVVYPPYDEDFGYVTLEAFLSKKPVVTASDSGGPNEFVVDGVNGFVCAPEPAALADAINRLAADRRRAASFGEAGYVRAAQVTWDGVIEKLVGQASAGAPDAAAALGWPAGGESPQATASAQRGGEAQRGPTERSDS